VRIDATEAAADALRDILHEATASRRIRLIVHGYG